MNKYNKGEYGYLKNYRKGKLIASIIFLAIIVFITVTVFIMFGDTKRVAIVFAILMALPLAKYLIAYIVCSKFKPLSKEDYDYIKSKTTSNWEDVLFDITISQYEGMKFYQSMIIKNGKVYAFVYDKNFTANKKQYVKWLSDSFISSRQEYKLFVTDKVDEYIKKVNSISTPNHNTMLIDTYVREQIFEKGV